MLITSDWLRSNGACEPKIALFKNVFGAEIELTRESIMRAAETNQSPRWLAETILDKEQIADFNARVKDAEGKRASLPRPVRKDPDYTGKAIEANKELRLAEAAALADILKL